MRLSSRGVLLYLPISKVSIGPDFRVFWFSHCGASGPNTFSKEYDRVLRSWSYDRTWRVDGLSGRTQSINELDDNFPPVIEIHHRCHTIMKLRRVAMVWSCSLGLLLQVCTNQRSSKTRYSTYLWILSHIFTKLGIHVWKSRLLPGADYLLCTVGHFRVEHDCPLPAGGTEWDDILRMLRKWAGQRPKKNKNKMPLCTNMTWTRSLMWCYLCQSLSSRYRFSIHETCKSYSHLLT